MERKYPKRRPIAIDFFCGAGGMSLGFEQAGFDIALGVDIDGHHIATHERNFPYGKSLCASISNLTGAQVRELVGTDEIDLVVGGPPCQGFSHMGLRDIQDPRNSLIDHFIRLVLEIRPRAFVMENVPGLLSGQTKKILTTVIEVVQHNGYKVTSPVQILDAAEFGVPQRRRRMFLLGAREDIPNRIPYPFGKCPGQPSRPTVDQAIADLPNVDTNESLFRLNDAPYKKLPASSYAKVARGLVADVSDLSRPRIWDSTICSGCLRTKHNPASVNLYRATPPGEVVPGHKLPRLHPDGVCPTLRAGSDSTHGSYTAPRPIHPIHPRCITAREAARLHGFPDWFSLYPSKWHAYRQVGNAVCPPVARAIGAAVLSVLGGSTTKLPPSAVPLDNRFPLADDRPRTLKRIPQMRQFPPVLKYLFAKAYDKDRKRLRKATFTFDDVQRAIDATGVQLHWVRADTFLSEIARSRRVTQMLAPILKCGYSIAPDGKGKAIGRFVPAGTPGTLDDKDTLQVRIDEIHDADPIRLGSLNLNGNGWGVIAALSEPLVQKILWQRNDCVVGLVESAINRTEGTANVYTVSVRKSPKFAPETTPVITCKVGALPNKTRIAKVAKRQASDTVTVLIAATSKHLVALRFDNCRSNPRETARGAFSLS